ncbi:aerobic-type carbon monoxide dehydrogenase small subunit (CoxS/CutS family) [Bradyrhizobium sp. ERR14]|nr:aerobic-type carbon monoxide dehydrogenase small subunit (CoxS/CutS family) [Bradyrhizobium sp. ERR14]
MTQTPIRLTVNGGIHEVAAAPETPLLYVLRNDLALNGPKYGCGLGECGTCTVLIDGTAARSCVIPVGGCAGRDIVTLEGLARATSLTSCSRPSSTSRPRNAAIASTA